MNNKLEVIGIDHGWSMMKTISQVFVTGVKEITTTPALFGDVLEYEGKFYKVGTVRQEVKDTKVEDDSFYLLTLAAVAKELKRRGLAEAKVFLAVGLPLTRFGAEKNDFIKYLTYHCSHWCGRCHHSCKECHGVRTSISAAGFIYHELRSERNCGRCHDGWYFNSSDILRLLRLGKCISPFSKRKEVNNKYGYF